MIVKGNAALPAVIRTATMGPGLSKDMVSNVAPLAANILSFDPSGFTVGSGASVNAGATTYQWVAFKAVAGQLKLGSYVGNGADNRSIAGIGFQPDYVVVVSQNWRPIQRSSAMAGDTSLSFEGAPAPNLIQALESDGFQVGSNLEVNESGATIHYAAWKALPGSMAVGAYTGGTPADNRSISVGFLPEYVIVKRNTNLGTGAGVHKTASSGLLTDIASRFDAAVNQVDMIQALQADGFQVGGDPRANSATAPNTYYWAAFGPHQPKTNYRSIGTAADYTTGTVGATAGSDLVLGIGTLWVSANRGRGDRILIEGTNYTVASVDLETQLRLTTAFIGGTGVGKAYTISRQYTTLSGWEDCVDGGPCPFFPVTSNDLVADDRSEVGVVYKDSVYVLGAPLDIDGSLTDSAHTIALTADAGNRHNGVAGTGVVIDNGLNASVAVRVRDDHVTLEWLEINGGSGAAADALETDNQAPANLLTLRSLLVHNAGGKGMDIRDADTVADVYNNLLYQTNGGIALGAGPFTGAIRLLNNTLYNCANNGILSAAATNGSVTLRNNIAHSHGLDFVVPASNAATSHNLSSDASAPGSAALPGRTLAAVSFVSTTPGAENLHIKPGSAAADAGADLGPIFTADVDAQSRTAPWDIGADEILGASTDLALVKADGQPTAVPGQSVTYTLTVTNNGPDTVTSLKLIDSVPGAIVAPAFAPSAGSYDDATGLWTGLSLATSQFVTLTLAGTIDPFARGSLLNTATVFPPAGMTDTAAGNDLASDSDTLDPTVAVKVVKTDDVDPAPLGGLLTYTLTVTNNGPSGATGVAVQDVLPVDMELDAGAGAITPSQGTCNYDGPTRTVSCALGNVAPLSPVTVAIKVHPQALRTFTNTASVTYTEPDPDASDDSAVETTAVEVSVSNIGVRVLTATSTSQQNVLEWLNPTDVDYLSTEIVVRGDRFPTGPGDGATIYLSGAGGSGGRVKFTHNTGALSNGMTFYYGAFAHRAVAPLLSPGRFCSGRPFDHVPGPVKWAFSTGATALAAPTVGGAGVIATSNDKVVYAMERGVDDDHVAVDSGEWPASFEPIDVGGPVQQRSPVVPVTVGGANPVVYVGSQDGSIYTIDATAGGGVPYLWVTSIGPMVQAAPAGIFSAFNGATLDYILVGTRDSAGPNAFVALDPYTGVEIDRFDNGGAGPGEIGIVNGMAAVDYGPPAPPRVYFTNYERTPVGSTLTLRCFELADTPPVFNQIWARALGNIDSSPVLRNGRVYVGSPLGGGTVYSIDALDGNNTALDRTFAHGNGQVKGFVFPDRASNDVYFATDDYVWGATDTGAPLMTDRFGGPVSLGATVKPSPVLFVPGSHYLYVGGSDGKLYELDVLGAPGIKSVTLGNGLATVGSPSLDRDYDLIHVGSEAGFFYAIQIPLP